MTLTICWTSPRMMFFWLVAEPQGCEPLSPSRKLIPT